MCGIVGYEGNRQALPILLDALGRVTYRGYDSFGVAVLNGRGIERQRWLGPVDANDDEINMLGTTGIAHTRWATIGGVSLINAHPHIDCGGRLALVHNGDIDNYQEIRTRLRDAGHEIRSETDSELIAHLVEGYLETDLIEALENATRELEGSYAIVVLDYRSKELALARRGSPIVVGLGDGETFIASDAPAILPYTDRVIYPEDGDIVLARNGVIKVVSDGKAITRPIHQLKWDASQTDKGDYDHYMLKEIYEQPAAIRDTLAAHADGLPELPHVGSDRVLMLGCGTSYHAALLGEALLSESGEFAVSSKIASEFVPTRGDVEPGLVVAFSQSGETTDTLTTVRELKRAGRKVIGITNVPESNLARESDAVLYTAAGPEVAVAATKTFTTQLTMASLLAADLMSGTEIGSRIASNARLLPGKVEAVLALSAELKAAGEWLAKYEHMFVIAKGANVPVAMEAALKFKEVAYLHAEGVPAGELKHGPFALLTDQTPVLAIVADDMHRTRMLTAIREIKTRGAPVVSITGPDSGGVDEFSDIVIKMPQTDPLLSPIVYTVAVQLMSYHCAAARNCEIDRPRNLAKSVTVP